MCLSIHRLLTGAVVVVVGVGGVAPVVLLYIKMMIICNQF